MSGKNTRLSKREGTCECSMVVRLSVWPPGSWEKENIGKPGQEDRLPYDRLESASVPENVKRETRSGNKDTAGLHYYYYYY